MLERKSEMLNYIEPKARVSPAALRSAGPVGSRIAAIAAALCLSSACVSMEVSSPRKNGPVVVQNSAAKCKPTDTFGQYYLLFGALPLRTISPDRMFPKADKSYRVTEKLEWYDIALTVVGGAFLSFSKNTIIIEECDAAGVFASDTDREAALKREADAAARLEQERIAKRLDEFTKARSKKFDATLVLKNGDVLAGRIKSISETKIILEVQASDAASEKQSTDKTATNEKPDSGKAAESDRVGTRVIERRDIAQIEFRDAP
ncbi:MAG: hypothetical protein NXI24_11065 [bacterium]|nr:hypothetical protein [bacterium]